MARDKNTEAQIAFTVTMPLSDIVAYYKMANVSDFGDLESLIKRLLARELQRRTNIDESHPSTRLP